MRLSVLNSAHALIGEKGLVCLNEDLVKAADNQCPGGHHCPQFLEMVDGDFAAVGTDITDEAIRAMLPGPGVGPKGRVIRIPRHVMIEARADIPAA